MHRFVHTLCLLILVMADCILVSAQVDFKQIILLSGDTGSNGIAAGDFNHDGILDLVTINNNSLSFYKGLGGGKYANVINTPPNPLGQPFDSNIGQVVAADFSGQGKLDLAILPVHKGTMFFFGGVDIWRGNNDGTFKLAETLDAGGGVMSIALADFNGDHRPDLAVSECSAPIIPPCNTQVFLNQGDGTFKLSTTLADGGGMVVAGDFNADGKQDIAVVAGNEIALYLGKGDGAFEEPILATLMDVASMAVGDFFNDRIQSLVALTSTPLADSNFKTQLFTLRFSEGHLLVENQRLLQADANVAYQQVAAGDLNGDFKDDIFLVGTIPSIPTGQIAAYMIGNGNGTFEEPVEVSVLNDPVFPFIRDLTGDSRHDVGLAGTDSRGGAEILLNANAAENCSLPPANRLAVHICEPAHNGQIVGETFSFKGSGNAFNGIAKRMELWIDGKKVAQNLEDQLKATVKLTRGKHIASFVVMDSFDEHTAGSVSFTSQF